MKCRYPDVFAAAMLNSQPVGFYAPAQLVRDAREHGVEMREVDVNRSDWDCTLEALLPANGEKVAGDSPPDEGRRGPQHVGNPAFKEQASPPPLIRPHSPSQDGRSYERPMGPPSPRERGEGASAGGKIHPRHAEMAEHIRATHAVRFGLRRIVGVREEDMRRLAERRGRGYDSVRDLLLRTGVELPP